MDLLKSLQALFGIDSAARMDRAAPKDEFRQHQDHDLYKKNIRLKEQLDEARERILQLENQLGGMEEESTEVEKNIGIQKRGNRSDDRRGWQRRSGKCPTPWKLS